MKRRGCWSIETAERRIHTYARTDFELAYTRHAAERLRERSILVSDVNHVLTHGYIGEEPVESSRRGYCKYKICSKSPNSGNREICLVVIPDPQDHYGDVEGSSMSQAMKRYHYTECGLPDVWIDGWHVEDDAGEETIRVPNVRSLHKLISTEIVTSSGTLTGPELRYLRTEMGLTQTQLAELVHRERLTVSRWERGESTLDGATEAYIRILASHKLELERFDPETVSAWCRLTAENKQPIRIDATDPDNYRLVA